MGLFSVFLILIKRALLKQTVELLRETVVSYEDNTIVLQVLLSQNELMTAWFESWFNLYCGPVMFQQLIPRQLGVVISRHFLEMLYTMLENVSLGAVLLNSLPNFSLVLLMEAVLIKKSV